MKKALVIILCVIALLLVSCDQERKEPDSYSPEPLQQPETKEMYSVTFIQEGQDPIGVTCEEGDPLWVYAPELPFHNVLNYYYNWDVELDTKITSDMTVTRIECEGNAVFFMNVDNQTIKIIERKSSAGWSDIKVSEFPAVPEIEGYEGQWDQKGDISYFSSSRQDITCWYSSKEKYSTTQMPKSFIVPGAHGRVAFVLSEYPIQVTGSTLKHVNNTDFASAAEGQTPITEAECSAVVAGLGDSFKETYATYNYKQATDYLVQNLPDLGFVNAIKVMRQQTEDNGWSIPQASEMWIVLRKLAELGTGEGSFYSYLYNGDSKVKTILCSSFFVSSGHRRILYSWISNGVGVSSEYLYGGTFTGYLWPIKPIE